MKRNTTKKTEENCHTQKEDVQRKKRNVVYQPDDFLAEIAQCISMIEQHDIESCRKMLKNIQEDFIASMATDMLLEVHPISTTIH